MKCPNCGKEAQGKYCAHCGAPLQAGHCAECGARLAPGARFCTQCGTGAAGASPRARGQENLGWYVAAGVLVILILVIGLPMVLNRDQPSASPAGTSADAPFANGAAGSGGAPGPLTGTPREQADRLFNKIMSARENGDTATATFFTPMGLQAYRGLGPDLDNDGRYHLAQLEIMGGEPKAGLATAQQILAGNPNHLLGLASAALASEKLGDAAAARKYWQQFLKLLPTERSKPLPEYQDHQAVLPEYETEAKKATGG